MRDAGPTTSTLPRDVDAIPQLRDRRPLTLLNVSSAVANSDLPRPRHIDHDEAARGRHSQRKGRAFADVILSVTSSASVKLTVTVMMIGTAVPFNSVGSYCHCFTASTAA